MAFIKDGWFSEINDLWYGQAMSFEIKEILYHKRSQFQDILVFESKSHGNVLVLDGCIQCTDRDEFTYQEMITYLPLSSHPCPKKVLVIGAGDGGVIREIAKHPSVESIVQCEIDEEVVNVSKKFLPVLSCGYSSPKHTLHIGCGKEFMKKHQGEFDVIITDSSDPIGPAASLFEKEYYQLMKFALKPDGLLCSQGECPWLDAAFINNMMKFCNQLFPVVQYAYTNVPTYPCGQIGFLMCSSNPETRFDQPLASMTNLSSFGFKLYNLDVHSTACVFPQYFKKREKDFRNTGARDEKDWFWEKRQNSPDQSLGLIKEEVHISEIIDDQKVLVFENFIYGKVMAVNDVIIRTERDQFFLDESLVHLALSCHENPKKVAIIGGLSGAILHEVSRYSSVEEIYMCEESQALLDVCKKYFGDYDHPKLREIHIGNYVEFLRSHPMKYDIIITSPAETFLPTSTGDVIKLALKSNGISISQLPSFWTDLDAINTLFKHSKTKFSCARLAYTCIPTKPFGQATFLLRSLNPNTSFENPVHQLPYEQLTQLHFYNQDVRRQCFALPQFVRKVIES